MWVILSSETKDSQISIGTYICILYFNQWWNPIKQLNNCYVFVIVNGPQL